MKSSGNAPLPLFEDHHLLIVNKPQGWLSQQDEDSDLPDLETWAQAYRKQREAKPGNVFVRAAHRLDAPVSGIVCLAKTSKALERLQKAQQERRWRKLYLALVTPRPAQDQAMLTHWLIQKPGRAVCASPRSQGAKEARLQYQVIASQGEVAALGVELLTGRYHQIRVQLAAQGSPILGDLKYGGQPPLWEQGIALHHSGLQLPHPTEERWITLLDLPGWAPPQAQTWLQAKLEAVPDSVKQS